ncbi:hypothetical protein PUN28_018391 [Cardiocondyla obscurior]|uniref:Protein argonaute-2 n=1 Tax=Cardiocondyla obscurior TaxID=286306 RepID=A0AAW2EJF7_9HYME
MTKKGKKKKNAASASTSKEATSGETSQQEQQKEQGQTSQAPGISEQAKVPQGPPQERQQVPQGPPQQVPQGPQQRQQVSQGTPQQKQQVPQGPQQVPQGLPQQRQQVPQGTPQQRQQIPQGWLQQQQNVPQSWPQQQVPQGWPQQQVPQGWPQQQQQVPQGWPQQQQQMPQDWRQQQQQQQVPQGWPQQQQQAPQGPAQPQPIIPQGSPQHQLQGAWGQQRQQVPQQVPSQQQQHVPQDQGQQQLQGAWSQQRQQVPQQVPSQQRQHVPQDQGQQQLQGAWGQQRQQVPQQVPSQQRQQVPQQVPSQQRQHVPQDQDSRVGGDTQQLQPVSGGQQQPSTSTALDMSKVSLTDPFTSQVTEKGKMSSAQIAAYYRTIPKRAHPDRGGTAGLKIQVRTNMFKILFDDKFITNAVHYDISITPSKQSAGNKGDKKAIQLPKSLCRDIFEVFRSKYFNNRYPAFDGKKNAFSAHDLPVADDMIEVIDFKNKEGRVNKYEISIKKVANIDLSWIKNLRPGHEIRDQTAVQTLDIIMRHAPESRFMNVGRSLYWPDKPELREEKFDLGGGLFLSRGGFMSGVLGWQPYLNVDVSHKGFTYEYNVLDYVADVAQRNVNSVTFNDIMRNETKIRSFLKGLKIIYQIPNSSVKRTHRIADFSQKTSYSTFMQDIEGKKQSTTIVDYFSKFKSYRIQKPDLPTLNVSTKGPGHEILLPLELCTIIPNQPIRKLDEKQTASMIKKAALPADSREERIKRAFNAIQVNSSPVMTKEFHLSVSDKMEEVAARVLTAPELRYNQKNIHVNRGTWQLDHFILAKSLSNNSWAILNLSDQAMDSTVNVFVQLLQRFAPEVGMRIDRPGVACQSYSPRDFKNIRQYFHTNKQLHLIIVVINPRFDTYADVKKIAEMEVGVLTQCVKMQTLRKLEDNQQMAGTTVKNILLKINSKLNGINHTFSKMPRCLEEPCMLIGADVTHPSPDSKDIPSIAAVASSTDGSAFRYTPTLRLQPPKEEMILDLQNIVELHLRTYRQQTKNYPKRIIYFRDGVSEGQLPQVMYFEINAIKNAIKSIGQSIEVTSLVVQKRHHVRFFPHSYEDRGVDRRTKNVQAGTIVDTNITHPEHIDFYLVSHASIQGTARPTKYRCIINESNFTEDQLEQMTYYLCHIYARCARSVSYPAPTYYAHLAAYRGRAYIQGKRDFNLENLANEQRNFVIRLTNNSPMFFV